MTRKELIGYCRYYKGEEKCPYERFSNKETFWEIESMYVDLGIHDETWRESMETKVAKYGDKLTEEKNIFTDDSVDIHTKGIAVYVFDMLAKWMPYDMQTPLEY